METTKDPVQEEKGGSPNRVARGGGWRSFAELLVVSYRSIDEPGFHSRLLGFRPVRNVKERE